MFIIQKTQELKKVLLLKPSHWVLRVTVQQTETKPSFTLIANKGQFMGIPTVI